MIPYNKRQDAQIVKIKDYINGKREYVTGEGTSLTLENTANIPFNNITLKGNTKQQQYSGKNLVPITAKSVERNGVTFTINNNQLTINGTATDYVLFFLNNEIWRYSANNPILEAGTYNLSFNNEIKFSKGGIDITIYNEDSKIIYEKVKEKNNFSFSISEKGSCTIRIEIMKGQVFDNNDLQFQIEQGSTATSYEPYTGGIPAPNPDYPQDINVVTGNQEIKVYGKNILDSSKISTDTINGITLNYDKDTQIFTVNGTCTADNTSFLILNSYYIKKNKTKIIGYYISGTIKNYIAIRFFKSNYSNSLILDLSKLSNTNKIVENTATNYFLAHSGQSSIRIDNGTTADNFKFKLMLTDSDDTEWKPYQSSTYPISLGNIELCKIGDYQDYIYKNNGKWYKHKVISKRICYPTGVASKLEGTTKAYLFGSLNDALMSNKFYREKGFCDISYNNMIGHMYGDKDDYGWNIEKDDTVNNNNFNIRFDKEKFPNLDTIKNYFKDKGVTFYYILATPTEEEITDTTLITQLDALEQAVSYDDTTNISQTNANLPFIINVEAVKKLL